MKVVISLLSLAVFSLSCLAFIQWNRPNITTEKFTDIRELEIWGHEYGNCNCNIQGFTWNDGKNTGEQWLIPKKNVDVQYDAGSDNMWATVELQHNRFNNDEPVHITFHVHNRDEKDTSAYH